MSCLQAVTYFVVQAVTYFVAEGWSVSVWMQLKFLSIKLASIFTDVVILSAYHACIKFVCCWQHKAKYQINELGSWILIIPSLGGAIWHPFLPVLHCLCPVCKTRVNKHQVLRPVSTQWPAPNPSLSADGSGHIFRFLGGWVPQLTALATYSGS